MEQKKTTSGITEKEYLDYLNSIPEHVSWSVRDAWNVKPPCEYPIPYCHADCPYAYECLPDLMGILE